MDTAAFVAGGAIVSLVLLQLIAAAATSLWNLARLRRLNELARTLLLERIEAARAVRLLRQGSQSAWNGYRKFVVRRKMKEANDICSFYLAPHDGKPLPGFLPGQYLTFQLSVPGYDKPVVRCYSLSDAPHPDHYRVTIKRVGPPPDHPAAPAGVSSNYFHDHVFEGDILDVKAPAGKFYLDPTFRRPVVLVGGGVGITPFLSMVNAVAADHAAREVWLFYGVRHGAERVFRDHLQQLHTDHPHIRVITVFSHPRDFVDEVGKDCDHSGHISLDLLKRYLPTNNYAFFICGPPPMMEAMTRQLKEWGVPKEDIRTEAFGPASVKAKVKATPATELAATAPKVTIKFHRSNRSAVWSGEAANLLEFAAQHGVEIPSACCAGSCGTCQLAVLAGDVVYDDRPDWEIEEGCCLACVGRPKGDVILDA